MSVIKAADNMINTYAYQNRNASAKKSAEKSDTDIAEVTKGAVKKPVENSDSGVYTKQTGRKDNSGGVSININAIRQQTAEQLIQMLIDVLNQQGLRGHIARSNMIGEILAMKDYLDSGGIISSEEQAAAAAAIAEDGPWGVEAVSDRIVAMAVALSGGDESKFQMMKSAIEAGFKAAEAIWGGTLPDISYRTFEVTMEKLKKAFNQLSA